MEHYWILFGLALRLRGQHCSEELQNYSRLGHVAGWCQGEGYTCTVCKGNKKHKQHADDEKKYAGLAEETGGGRKEAQTFAQPERLRVEVF